MIGIGFSGMSRYSYVGIPTPSQAFTSAETSWKLIKALQSSIEVCITLAKLHRNPTRPFENLYNNLAKGGHHITNFQRERWVPQTLFSTD